MYLSHSCRAFLLFFISVTLVIYPNNSQPTRISFRCDDPFDNTTDANSLRSDLTSLLDSLSSKAALNSFYKESVSSNLFGLFLCRGDVSTETCQNCTRTASQEIKTSCANSRKSAIIWYDECMLRYSKDNFFGEEQTLPGILMWNLNNRTSPDEPDFDALALMYRLIAEAPETNMLFKTDDYLAGDGNGRHTYGLVQCTRDINGSSCRSCLNGLLERAKECCQAKIGWRMLGPSCNMRYESYMFYHEPTSAPPTPGESPVQPTPEAPGPNGNNTTIIILATIMPVAVAASLIGFVCYLCSRRKRRQKGGETSDEILLKNLENSLHLREQGINATDEDNSELHYFSLSTINVATNYFSDENKLGEGGFGPVFKGKLINGKDIAVKRLSFKSKQGLQEFKNEVTLIARLQHKNLVRLLGCCLEANEKLLVYEYMANTSLDAFLFEPTKRKVLDWPKRAKIINGIARGLLYLHEDSRLKIIHRDLKASNVLLDEEMNPKISDFGTARIFGGNQIEANTDRVVGTFGYMAPEYALEGLFSVKSDVYSYGVLLLEIISGKKNSGFYHPDHVQSLLLCAWQLWNDGKALEFMDPELVNSCPIEEVLRWIHIGLLCVQDGPNDRPTMSSVVLMLGSNIKLPQPFAPPFSVGRYFVSDQSSSTGQDIGFRTSSTSATT